MCAKSRCLGRLLCQAQYNGEFKRIHQFNPVATGHDRHCYDLHNTAKETDLGRDRDLLQLI